MGKIKDLHDIVYSVVRSLILMQWQNCSYVASFVLLFQINRRSPENLAPIHGPYAVESGVLNILKRN